MDTETLIKRLESKDRRYQCHAAIFAPLEDRNYSILPLMIDKAQEVDINHPSIDLDSSNFVGLTARAAAKLIRRRDYSSRDPLHLRAKDWILKLNYCTDMNIAGHSVNALGDLWIPPDSIRERLIQLVHTQCRPENQDKYPSTIRALAYRMLSLRDRDTARQLIDMPARKEFQNLIAHLLDEYRIKYPNNEKVPHNLRDEVEWLKDEDAG